MRFATHILTVVLISVLFIAGCNQQDESDRLPGARALLSQSAADLQNASSFEMEIDVTGYPVEIALRGLQLPPEAALEFKYARGVFQSPDRLSAVIQFSVGDFNTTAELIAIGRQHFFRGEVLTANRWIRGELIEGFTPASLVAQPGGIAYALDSIAGLSMVGEENLDGLDVFHLRGTLQAANAYALTFGLIHTRQGSLDIEVYIETANRQVTRFMFVEPPPAEAEDAEPTTWLFNLMEYNREVSITPPPMDGQ